MSARKRRTSDVEWIGGSISLPTYVVDEGEPFRPEAFVWMAPDGAIIGTTLSRPDELPRAAVESLEDAIKRPMSGAPRRPQSVRVASAEWADALRAGHPGIEVVRAPTPELDEALELMAEAMSDNDEGEQSYLPPGVEPDAMASFFEATAGLFRAEPWKRLPDDAHLFSVTIEQLGVRDVAMSVMGRMEQESGLLFFSGLDDFDAYVDAGEALELGETPRPPPHFAVHFERGAELPPELRREVDAYRWRVAGADAYPWLSVIDEDLVARPPTAEEVGIAEAVAVALTNAMEDGEALDAAWSGGSPWSRTWTTPTVAGEVEVTLRAPYERPFITLPFDGREELDPEERERFETELMLGFRASPEGRALEDTFTCQLVMDFAANYFDATVETLEASELREIVFEIIPRKVLADASEARGMVEALRAFYGFIKRERGFPHADACLRVVGDGAVEKLESALSDSYHFGPAKRLFSGLGGAAFGAGTRGASTASARGEAASRKKKAKRKAANKSRKKNR